MTVVAIIQARMTSTRLPGKVMADLAGVPLLAYMLHRVFAAKRLDAIWVATTRNDTDAPIVHLCDHLGVAVFRGDEDDVLGRYAGTAAAAKADVIVRLTSDCPMIDAGLIDESVERFSAGTFDYLSNAIELSYPDGLDIEIFTRDALEQANREATLPFHREHVTPYMRTGVYQNVPTGDFRVGQMRAPADFSHLRWTVDTADDLARVRRLVGELPAGYSWMDVLALLTRRPELLDEGTVETAAIQLRPAQSTDTDLLFAWVNSPDKRAVALKTTGRVARETHDAWFAARLASPQAGIWIAENGGRPVGQARLEQKDGALEVDIYVDGNARERGVGTAILDALRLEAARRWPGVPLLARIKADNMASRRLFAKAGYGRVVVAPDHLIFHRDPARPEEAA